MSLASLKLGGFFKTNVQALSLIETNLVGLYKARDLILKTTLWSFVRSRSKTK